MAGLDPRGWGVGPLARPANKNGAFRLRFRIPHADL